MLSVRHTSRAFLHPTWATSFSGRLFRDQVNDTPVVFFSKNASRGNTTSPWSFLKRLTYGRIVWSRKLSGLLNQEFFGKHLRQRWLTADQPEGPASGNVFIRWFCSPVLIKRTLLISLWLRGQCHKYWHFLIICFKDMSTARHWSIFPTTRDARST